MAVDFNKFKHPFGLIFGLLFLFIIYSVPLFVFVVLNVVFGFGYVVSYVGFLLVVVFISWVVGSL